MQARRQTPCGGSVGQTSDAFQRDTGRLRTWWRPGRDSATSSTRHLQPPGFGGLARRLSGAWYGLARRTAGLNVFLVRSIGRGDSGARRGAPGPPDLAGTPASGIAVDGSPLLSRVGTYRAGRRMRSRDRWGCSQREPEGYFDPIPTASCHGQLCSRRVCRESLAQGKRSCYAATGVARREAR